MIRLADRKDCCGCGACAAVCPHGAISMVPDGMGFRYPRVDMDRCVDCHRCEDVCAFAPNRSGKGVRQACRPHRTAGRRLHRPKIRLAELLCPEAGGSQTQMHQEPRGNGDDSVGREQFAAPGPCGREKTQTEARVGVFADVPDVRYAEGPCDAGADVDRRGIGMHEIHLPDLAADPADAAPLGDGAGKKVRQPAKNAA